MSRLPDLERALLDAAIRLDAPVAGKAATPQNRRRARRWRRPTTPLLAGLASLVVAGAAVAAVTGLLDSGEPVPDARSSPLTPSTHGFTLASVRASDPDGGPEWAVGTYDAIPTTMPSRRHQVPAGIAAQLRKPVTCVVVGRIQNAKLGVVGRDGVFGNDGRFHALSPAAQTSTTCSGRAKDGTFVAISSGPPIAASGYTGPPGTPIGGCRERVDLNGPTVSPQTRRKLRGVPQCNPAGLRRVVAGFAGPHAASATLVAPGYRKTLKLQPKENGAYLFVVRSTSVAPPRLTITQRNGHVCEPFYSNTLRTAAQRAEFARHACSGLTDATP